jgi:hypothetical protein
MSTKIIKGESGNNFIPPPAGSYPARCVGLIVIGLTDVPYMNEIQKKSLIRLRYELPTELEEFKEGEPKQPWVVEIEFTNTTGTKGNLYKWLTNWSPKITKDNIDSLDLAKILGVPGMLTVTHNPDKKDATKVYLKAAAIAPVPKNMEVAAQMNETFLFDVEEFDQEKFNTIPKFIRKKILASEEFKASGLNPVEVDNIAAEARGENKTAPAASNENNASAQQAVPEEHKDNSEAPQKGDNEFF